MARGQIPHDLQRCFPELKPSCSLYLTVILLSTLSFTGQSHHQLFSTWIYCWCSSRFVYSVAVPLAPWARKEGGQGLQAAGRQRYGEVAWKASATAQLLCGSCRFHLSMNWGTRQSCFSQCYSQLFAPACSSRRELLSPGMGPQPPRKGICANKNVTSGNSFGCLLNVFRTRVANKSKCLSNATRFYFI